MCRPQMTQVSPGQSGKQTQLHQHGLSNLYKNDHICLTLTVVIYWLLSTNYYIREKKNKPKPDWLVYAVQTKSTALSSRVTAFLFFFVCSWMPWLICLSISRKKTPTCVRQWQPPSKQEPFKPLSSPVVFFPLLTHCGESEKTKYNAEFVATLFLIRE